MRSTISIFVFANRQILAVHIRHKIFSRKEIVNKPWEKTRNDFFRFFNINHQGVFHHRYLFDESFRLAGDYELLLRSIKRSDNIVFLDSIIVSCRQTSGLTSLPANYIETIS